MVGVTLFCCREMQIQSVLTPLLNIEICKAEGVIISKE